MHFRCLNYLLVLLTIRSESHSTVEENFQVGPYFFQSLFSCLFKNPYKFVITGRTKHFINAFGEELIVDNAEKGLAKACAETGAQVSEYTAAPVFMDENAKCRHQWLIEFAKMPDSVEKFAAILDATLKEVNSDYEAKRWKDIALQPLEVIVAREGLFHDWLAQRGKLGGQHKVPRLSNTREYIETMLALNDSILSEE